MKDLESSPLHQIKVGDTLTFTDSGWSTITRKGLERFPVELINTDDSGMEGSTVSRTYRVTFDTAGIFEVWITKYNPFTNTTLLSVVVVNVSVT